MGQLKAIARRDTTRAPMELLTTTGISVEAGVDGDFRGKSKKRQVTLLSEEVWAAVCRELGQDLPWTTRRSNLFVSGVELPRNTGDVITVGDVRLLVTAEVDPCNRMDEQCPGLRAALVPEWRGGVGCTVLEGGTVSVGDAVTILPGRGD